MTAATKVKVSTCVDCATPILGERLRCPACNQHAVNLLAGDEDVTLPRDRERRQLSVGQVTTAWIVVVLLFAVVVILLILAGKACR